MRVSSEANGERTVVLVMEDNSRGEWRTGGLLSSCILFPLIGNCAAAFLVAGPLVRSPIGGRVDPMELSLLRFIVVGGTALAGIGLTVISTKTSGGRGKLMGGALYCLILSLTPIFAQMLVFNMVVSHRHLIVGW